MRASLDRGFGIGLFALALSAPVALSCSPTTPFNGFDGGAGHGGMGGAGPTTSASSSTGDGGGLGIDGGLTSTGSGGAQPTCNPGGPDDDVDKDGYTPNQGDCDDCDPYSNPNAVEVIATDGSPAKDENCDGQVDEVEPPCDTGFLVDDLDPLDAVRAVDLCKQSSGPTDWGVVGASWVMPDGSPPPLPPSLQNFHLGHGLLAGFGPNVHVRRGARLLALSSGTARQPDDPGYLDVGGFSKGYTGKSPPGFPKESPACPGTLTGDPNDPTGIEVKIRVPSNAHGFSFDFDFFTYEWPGFICSSYNDFFIAILAPIPMGQMDGNISFDSQGNPVSVNNAFLDVCGCPGNPPNACPAGGKSFPCALGDVELIGTGFGFDTAFQDHGSTSWLQTTAPAAPGTEITLRWAVYDSSDGVLDTTTLIDNWQWIATPGITVGTTPVPK